MGISLAKIVMGPLPISCSNTCKFLNFNGSFEIFMGPLELDGPDNPFYAPRSKTNAGLFTLKVAYVYSEMLLSVVLSTNV